MYKPGGCLIEIWVTILIYECPIWNNPEIQFPPSSSQLLCLKRWNVEITKLTSTVLVGIPVVDFFLHLYPGRWLLPALVSRRLSPTWICTSARLALLSICFCRILNFTTFLKIRGPYEPRFPLFMFLFPFLPLYPSRAPATPHTTWAIRILYALKAFIISIVQADTSASSEKVLNR